MVVLHRLFHAAGCAYIHIKGPAEGVVGNSTVNRSPAAEAGWNGVRCLIHLLAVGRPCGHELRLGVDTYFHAIHLHNQDGWYCCSKQVEIRSAWLSGSADAELMMVDRADS